MKGGIVCIQYVGMRDKLWRRVWLMAGRLEEIPNVGNYLTFEILDDSVIVVRTATDRIAAYFNVCPHRGRRVVLGLEPDEAVRRPFDVGDVLGEEDVAVLAEEFGEFGGAKVGRKVSHEQILGLVPPTPGGGTAALLAPSFALGRVGVGVAAVGARGVARADEVRDELLPPRGVVLSVARPIAVLANRRRRRRPRVGLGRGRVVRNVPHRRFDLRDGGVGAGGVLPVVAALVPVVWARRSTPRAKPNERRATRSAVGALAEDPGAARGEDATRRTECDAT